MDKKQIRGGIILSSLSQLINILVGLLYTPIMMRILGQNEYGIYQLILSLVNYLNLMNLGFNGAYIRYYTLAKMKGKKKVEQVNGMFLSIFSIIACLCLIAGGILYFNINILGNKLSSADYILAKKLLLILVLNIAISFPNSLYIAFMSAKSDFITQKAVNIITNIITPFFNLAVLMRGKGSVGIVSITLFVTIIRFVFNVFYCKIKLNMRSKYFYFDFKIFKDLFAYTIFIFISDLVEQLNSNVDKFLLGRMIGATAVAIYSVGYNLKMYYTQLTWLIPEMYIPEVNRVAIEEKSDSKLAQLFTLIGRYNNYIVLLVISGYILLGRQFITLWVGNEYKDSFLCGLILMISGYIPAVQTLGVNIQNAKDMHQMRSIIYLLVACCNVVTSVFLIKIWGIIGTCLGTLFATLLGNGIFMNIYYREKIGLDIKFFWKTIAKWVPYAGTVFLLGLFATKVIYIDNWFALAAFVVIYVVIYFAVLFAFELSRDERKKVMKIFRRFK